MHRASRFLSPARLAPSAGWHNKIMHFDGPQATTAGPAGAVMWCGFRGEWTDIGQVSRSHRTSCAGWGDVIIHNTAVHSGFLRLLGEEIQQIWVTLACLADLSMSSQSFLISTYMGNLAFDFSAVFIIDIRNDASNSCADLLDCADVSAHGWTRLGSGGCALISLKEIKFEE